MRAVRGVLIGLALALAPAGAVAGGLGGDSTGADWLKADPIAKAQWLLRVEQLLKLPAEQQRRVGLGVGSCLTEALTARNREERIAVEAFKSSTLAELTAVCAGMEMSRVQKSR